MQDSQVVCTNGNGEDVLVEATVTAEPPAQYTGCHSHGEEQFCIGSDGDEVLVLLADKHLGEHQDHDDTEVTGSEGEDCHFHAGVEHCVGPGESESSTESHQSCNVRTRDYDIPLRVGTLFAILATSSIGVFGPIFLNHLPFGAVRGIALSIMKQFGTGVIVSTALVHLYTHASLMFANECLGRLSYEATTSAVVMAGIFLAFLVEYVSHRILLSRAQNSNGTAASQAPSRQCPSPDKTVPQPALATYADHHLPPSGLSPNTYLSVLVMEAGILFHSILIGLTLVVAADSYYITLFIVIVFHQFFEGVALGSRIAVLSGSRRTMIHKLLMAAAFVLITPLGMAIGLGVLNHFNGNDPSTIVAIGTLDALSAGILLWVGVVDMWARDWVVVGGELVDAAFGKVLCAGLSLVSGMVLMGVLGKWA
ncbi:hypothetical protein G647_08495 [Cladophialophora carrionii CBS 160.54]|uniref:ZIP Zinc transporter n=1 Tax=Cladophialophora carrionii CBS 160.54 TaxID=1279043 RepID=V9D0M0_9EURO|nr:uncharacterized protein G647_08495 [Cladophialophora carrionii CBS 160.54]ETI20459.1 hypothetical protein G647_08495 [Cladophialophora carrionii CBS 160.54]